MGQHTMPAIKQLQRSIMSFDHNQNQPSFQNSALLRFNSKPTFQAFQLRPWTKDANNNEGEEALKGSLGIYGPGVASEISSRAKSVPCGREKSQAMDRDEVRTAYSVSTSRELLSLAPKSSLEAMPVRPALSRTKQIPGRYFPKAMHAESARVVSFSTFRRYKPPVRPRTQAIGNSKSLDTNNLPIESSFFLDALPKSQRHSKSTIGYIAASRRVKKPISKHGITVTEFPEIKSEVFAICFNNTGGSSRRAKDDAATDSGWDKSTGKGSQYDPSSELHSDYYTIKRLSLATPASSTKTNGPVRAFSVVLRGQPKLLHPKLLLMADDLAAEVNPGKKEATKSAQSSAVTAPVDSPKEGQTGTAGSENNASNEDIKPAEVITPPAKMTVKIDSALTMQEDGSA